VALANEILKEEGSIVICKTVLHVIFDCRLYFFGLFPQCCLFLLTSPVTSFVAVAKEVHQKLEAMGWNGQLLTGETIAGRRQEMVDDFQSGVTPVFVCTYGEHKWTCD
jgi:SNF2 family DNA or RNA helicase